MRTEETTTNRKGHRMPVSSKTEESRDPTIRDGEPDVCIVCGQDLGATDFDTKLCKNPIEDCRDTVNR